MYNFISIGSGVLDPRGVEFPNLPLTVWVALTTVLRTNVLHCYDTRLCTRSHSFSCYHLRTLEKTRTSRMLNHHPRCAVYRITAAILSHPSSCCWPRLAAVKKKSWWYFKHTNKQRKSHKRTILKTTHLAACDVAAQVVTRSSAVAERPHVASCHWLLR